jgi:hypothetical protein
LEASSRATGLSETKNVSGLLFLRLRKNNHFTFLVFYLTFALQERLMFYLLINAFVLSKHFWKFVNHTFYQEICPAIKVKSR